MPDAVRQAIRLTRRGAARNARSARPFRCAGPGRRDRRGRARDRRRGAAADQEFCARPRSVVKGRGPANWVEGLRALLSPRPATPLASAAGQHRNQIKRNSWRPSSSRSNRSTSSCSAAPATSPIASSIPRLLHRDKSEQFTDPTRIIGVSRRQLGARRVPRLRARCADEVQSARTPSPSVLERFLDRARLSSRSTRPARPAGRN